MDRTKPRIIAFTGPKTCGKDTMAECLTAQNVVTASKTYNYFRRTPMAEGVKSICSMVFGWSMDQMDNPAFKETKLEVWPNIEPRWAMMDIANFMRDKYGGGVWVKTLEQRIQHFEKNDPYGAYVITDLRFPEELEWLQSQDSLVIYVERTEAEQALAAAKAAGDAKALNPSEAHYELLKSCADVLLHNDGEIHQGHRQVFGAVRQKWGHWAYWNNQ